MRRHAWNCDLSTKPGTDILTNRHMPNACPSSNEFALTLVLQGFPQHGVIYPSMKARRIMPVGRFHPMDSSAEDQQGLKMRRMRRFS